MSYSIPIHKLMHWRSGNWVRYDQNVSSAVLKIHYDQLLIFSNTQIFESLNINAKTKGFYKGDVMILITSSETEVRKIKFRVTSDFEKYLEVLKQRFPVVCHGVQSSNAISSKYRNIDEVLRCAVEKMEIKDKSEETFKLPSSNYTNFVKLCLLDPSFPQVVRETQNILETMK